MSDLAALILAGGLSRRMRSPLSKILHPVAGRPLLHYPVAAARAAGASRVIVITSPKDRDTVEEYLVQAFGRELIQMAVQDPPRGTGDAARVGLDVLDRGVERALILCGDIPLIAEGDLRGLVSTLGAGPGLVIGTCRLSQPEGYGRIVRDERGDAIAIVEQRDLKNEEDRAISEINAGLYAVSVAELRNALGGLSPNNAQGEYYLTDIVPTFARAAGVRTFAMSADAIVGVNDRSQLHSVEEQMFRRIAERHRVAGSSIASAVCIDDAVVLGNDVRISSNVHLRGNTSIADGCVIDVGCVIENTTVGAGAKLLPYTVVSDSQIGAGCQLGPFSHARPGSVLEADVKLGNFVETKATRMRRGSKANHLSYLGDGDVGENTNIGAGTIFCNYDGYSKHKTTIGRDVFVGSDSQIIAPVSIGDGAYVATGSSVTEDVPAQALAIGRVRQSNKPGYASGLRARLEAAKKSKATTPKGHK
jgi:bifunctional UDP-N-acetylglucosamine pyrophosphorylase / glucosamine-1-phosphate N-acetyltransferase